MPDTPTSDARRRRRRGRGRPNPNNSNNNSNSSTPSSYFQKQPKQTGLQKFLSVISFGLLGKPTPKPRQQQQSAPPVRFEGGNRPERGERGERSERPERRGERGERGERSERPDRGERPQREPRAPREPRPAPTPAEVTSERLYVGNLSYDATEGDLFELFNGVGKVQNAEVVVNNRTQRSKGFAFVTMASTDEAKRAVAELNGKDFMGRALQISGAKPVSPDRDSHKESDDATSADDAATAEE